MSLYRNNLPVLGDRLLLACGGLETTLIFHDGFDLPHFAAFHLLKDAAGRRAIVADYERFLAIARASGTGIVLDSAGWRASPDWGEKLGYSKAELAAANIDSIDLLLDLRERYQSERMPVVVSGAIGPRGDGYVAGALMSPEEAEAYHGEQIAVYAGTEADMVCAYTLTNANEAIGIARAAQKAGMPVALSFTLETDGRLPSGQTLKAAITEVDAVTGRLPVFYMINCAHPDHFAGALAADEAWTKRIRSIRANASRRSHQELNEAPDLDAGDPVELGELYRGILARHPQITVLGGCCGTDHRHVACISDACRLAA